MNDSLDWGQHAKDLTEPNAPAILIIDDNPTNLRVITDYLEEYGFIILVARNGESGVEKALHGHPDIILLDIMMPGIDGFETCQRLKTHPALQDIPVIFMTALSNVEDKIKGFKMGAVDYITKPFRREEVLARVVTHLRMRKLTKHLQQQSEKFQTMTYDLLESNSTLSKLAIQLEASNEVGQHIISILNLDELLLEVVKLIQLRFGYYFVAVWLITDQTPLARNQQDEKLGKPYYKGDTIILQAWAGYNEGHLSNHGEAIVLGNDQTSIIPWVCRTGESYLITDIKNDNKYLAWDQLPKTESQLVLPLRIGQRIIGVLDIRSDAADAFNIEDPKVLQALANQLSVAIRNANLYDEISHLNHNLEEIVGQRTSELNKAYQTLERLDKTKADFLKVTSHELRTPLSVIKGYSQLLKEMLSSKTDSTTTELVVGIVSGVERLYQIVNTMLDVVKIDTQLLEMHAKPTTLANIIGKVKRRIVEEVKDRRLTLIIPELEGLPIIQADVDLMFKVFYNIVINAIKYTPDGGTITVSGKAVQRPNGKQAVEVIISDTGIGIDPAHHEQIFEKFYQTGDADLHSSSATQFKGGGPGLGLAIVRGIVLAHGGEVWVESTEYNEETCPGSHFHVLLPLEQTGRSG